MVPRRRFIGQAFAAGSVLCFGAGHRADAQDRFDQRALLSVDWEGDVTLAHLGDLRGVRVPHFARPAAQRIAPPGLTGQPPYLAGEMFRIRYGVGGLSPMDAALTHDGFDALAATYGPMGGEAHARGVLRAMRTARPDLLVLGDAQLSDNGDAEANRSSDAENRIDLFLRGQTKIAVLRRTSVDMDALLATVTRLQAQGAGVIVLISSAGFGVDREVARFVRGIDIIFSQGDGLVLPEPERISDTYIVASGTQGRFVSRIDLHIVKGRQRALRYKLVPVFADLITPDPQEWHASAVANRATEPLGMAAQTLFRRGTFSSTWDDSLAKAMRQQTGAAIAFLPGDGVDHTVLPGHPVTPTVLQHVTGAACIEIETVSGAAVKETLEEAANAVFSKDPFERRGTEMLRASGVGFKVDPAAEQGNRISLLRKPDGAGLAEDETVRVATLGTDGVPLEKAARRYFARANPDTFGGASVQVQVLGAGQGRQAGRP